ncbi:MAG: Helix-turn-helix domain [Firmicutes bacterium]|nr:Helix-turn-helix domain [Bacillota bacterium]
MIDEEKLNTITGERLKECRKALHQTLEQLAETSGYSVQHLIRIEKGRQRMTLEAAEMFASALHVRKEYLLNKDAYKTLAEKLKDDLVVDDGIYQALGNLLKALGYTITETEAIYEDSKTGEMCNSNEYDFGEWPCNMKHIGDIDGYVVFEHDGNLRTLKEEDFKKQFPTFMKLNSAKYELTYYDFPDRVLLTDDNLNEIFDEIFDLIGFVMDRQKDIRKNK